MSRFETPDMALRRARVIMAREQKRQSSIGAAVQRLRREFANRPARLSEQQQNRSVQELFARSSPQEVQRLQTLTTDQLRREAQTGRRITAPADIGSPTGEAVFPGVVGKIPGLRTPAEAASTIGSGGLGSLPVAAKAGGLALGLGGAFGGGRLAEEAGAPPWTGELAGGLAGGLGGGVAGPVAARRIGSNLDIATQQAGGLRQLAAQETGGTRIPRRAPVEEIPEEAIPSSPWKLVTQAVKSAGKATPEQRTMFAQQRAQRTAIGAAMLERGEGTEAFRGAKGALSGEFERPQFAVPEFTDDAMLSLKEDIRTANIPFYSKLHAHDALEEMASGRIPQPALLRDLQRVNPEAAALVSAITSKRSVGTKAWAEALSLIGLDRKFKAAFDFGSRMRQGLVLGWSHPRQWLSNWKPTVNAMFSERSAQEVMGKLETNPWYAVQSGERAGLGFVDQGGHIYNWDPLTVGTERVPGFEGMSDTFINRATDHIPGLKGSQRAWAVDLNKSGVEVYAEEAQAMWNIGVRDPNMYRASAAVINHARGYGSFNVGEIAKGIHALFSGRLFVSRFQVLLDPLVQPGSLFKPSARRLAAKNLVGMVAGDMSVLGLIATAGAATGVASVEMNPLKPGADWLKVRVGPTRIDPWGGFQPMVRLITRMAAAAATETGAVDAGWTGADVKRELITFFTNKEAPLVRLMTDAAGFTYPFEKRTLSPKLLAEIYAPFITEDVWEAVKEHGWTGLATAPASLVGMGVQTYGPPEEEPEEPAPKSKKRTPQINPATPQISPRRRELEGAIGGR